MSRTSRFALFGLMGIMALVNFGLNGSSAGSASEEEPLPVVCTITSSNSQWSKKNGTGITLTITNKSKQAINLRVLPSLLLISVPSVAGEPAREFWAPFNLTQSKATKEWLELNLAKESSIKREIAASDLMWSPVESSVWPEKAFFETVPNGQFRLRVQIDLKQRQPILSNDVAVILSDR